MKGTFSFSAIISGLLVLVALISNNNMTNIYRLEIQGAGLIEPKGWIHEQLKQDLEEGYIGQFDKVHHSVTHNVFVKQNRLSKRKFTLRKEWWSGEHEGYWKDGVIRMAYLTHNEKYIERARQWVDEIINHIGDDGYIGIYKDCDGPNCRFNHIRGNGELWTTSRIVMALLAYYEFTNDKKVLDAAINAVKLVMEEYSNKNYFAVESNGGGVSHGVGFFETLEWLYRITKKTEYLEFAQKLYKDFNNGKFRDDDLKTINLLDSQELFSKHGAHVAEGLFVPRFIANIAKNQEYNKAANNVIPKLKEHLTPGGAMRCDEWIKGREGTADERYEYCGIAEMISPLNKMIAFTGNYQLADLIETMTFNAGQGARFPTLTALSYLTSDNRIKINHRELVRRESYDAAHLAAVCCVLNGSRLMPYYVEGMWMKDLNSNAIVAMLFGPSEFNTTINEVPVSIKEETSYPFSDTLTFKINPEKNIEFAFIVRRPYGCKNVKIEAPETTQIEQQETKIILLNTWKKGDMVKVTFDFDILKVKQPSSKTVEESGFYLKRGALVYALPFKYTVDTVKEHNNSGFYRYKIKPEDTESWKLKIEANDNFEFYQATGDDTEQKSWDKPKVFLKGVLRNKYMEKEKIKLIPMGHTIFRRVTFSEAKKF
ncbi:MAG: glycoside hydrolase family 127 protein [Bacteroidales bacterium]|nr:glycoside hydrolase family 127 protein [Bacteroidales bacterium]